MAISWRDNYLRYKSLFLNIAGIYTSKTSVVSFIEIILSSLTITVFSLFAIKPTILTIIDLNKEIENKENTIVKINQKLTNLRTANKSLQQISDDIALIYSSLPPSAQVQDAVGQLKELAKSSGVEVVNISSSDIAYLESKDSKSKESEKEKLPQGSQEINLSISANGNYQEVDAFLKRIENLRRPIKIDSLYLSRDKKSEVDGNVFISITISGRMPFLKGEIENGKNK